MAFADCSVDLSLGRRWLSSAFGWKGGGEQSRLMIRIDGKGFWYKGVVTPEMFE